MSIELADAKFLAAELAARYDPLRAMTLMARLVSKAIFARKPNDVVFWALVYAYYRGNDLDRDVERELATYLRQALDDAPPEV